MNRTDLVFAIYHLIGLKAKPKKVTAAAQRGGQLERNAGRRLGPDD